MQELGVSSTQGLQSSGASGRAKRAQWQFRTSDNRIECGFDQICRQFGEFLVADAEATRKDFKVLVFESHRLGELSV